MIRQGLGNLRTWLRRVQVYGALRKSCEEEIPLDQSALSIGLSGMDAFERSLVEFSLPPAFAYSPAPSSRWQEALEVLFGNIRNTEQSEDRTLGGERVEAQDSSGSPAAEGYFPEVADLADRYRPVVVKAALVILKDEVDAEVVAAETFERIFHLASQGRLPANVSEAYVTRAASNLALNLVRTRKRDSGMIELEAAEFSASQPLPSQQVEYHEFLRTVRRACMRLPTAQRTVFWLCDVMEWRVGAVSEILNKSRSSVRNLRRRARNGLREPLETLRLE